MVERVYGATSLNLAIQDGKDAGQSVPHVHAHVIPRKNADLDNTDAVYEMMEGEQGDIGAFQAKREEERKKKQGERGNRFPVIESEERRPRTDEEMQVEAEMLAEEMRKELEKEK